MNKQLAIYACSGVGDGEERTLQYYLEGTNTLTNTQAQNMLLLYINEQYTALQHLCKTDEERALCLNRMDLYAVCFYFSVQYKQDQQRLANVGYILNEYIENGKLSISSVKIADHDVQVGAIIDLVEAYDQTKVVQRNTTFTSWYNRVVASRNFTGLTAEQQEQGEAALKNGAVSGDYGDISKYLNDAGEYFLYLYFTDEQIKKLGSRFRIKAKKQQEVYNYCKRIFVQLYGTEDDMKRIIRNGIIQRFNATPEEVVDSIMNRTGTGEGVGELAVTVAVAIVLAVATVVALAIAGVINAVQAVQVAKYTVPTDTDSGVPSDELDDWVNSKKSSSTTAIYAGLGALAFWLLSKSKKKKKHRK